MFLQGRAQPGLLHTTVRTDRITTVISQTDVSKLSIQSHEERIGEAMAKHLERADSA